MFMFILEEYSEVSVYTQCNFQKLMFKLKEYSDIYVYTQRIFRK